MTTKHDLLARRSKLSPSKLALLEMRAKGNFKSGHTLRVMTPRHLEEPTELSFAQDRLWFLNQLDSSSSSYNVFTIIRLDGVLDVGVFEKAINEVIRRHEVLRTIFVQKEGKPLPVIIPNLKILVSLINLNHHPSSLRNHLVQSLSKKEARRPFALNQGPLIRAMLFNLDVNHHVFMLTLHHIVSDQWSIEIFLEELGTIYEAFLNNKTSPLPELSLQYTDYAYWQKQWLQEEPMQQQFTYWKTKLENLPTPIQLPFSRIKKRSQRSPGALRSLDLPPVISTKLHDLRKQQNTTLFSLLLAAFVTLLHRYTGQTDILVGTPIANRNQEDLQKLIGFFLNTLVLRFDLSGRLNFQEFAKCVHEEVMDAFANQDFPFEKLVAALKPDRGLWSNPFFEIMYVFETNTEPMKGLKEIQTTPIEVDIETSKFDLTLFVTENQKNISLALEYNTDLFDDLTIIQILGNLTTLLEGIADNANQKLSELPILNSLERKQTLQKRKPTTVEGSTIQCWLDWFDQQVQRKPHTKAIVNGHFSLDYQQLNAKANQLAHYLFEHGVGPEVLVAILTDRSVDMIVGLLGVLKAGGAYVPLDPGYPPERLALILEDTQASMVLTQHKHLEKLSELKSPKVCLDSDWEAISQNASSENIQNIVLPQHLAYVIYTSGSSGQPKGVMVTHRNLVSSNQARLEYYTQELQSFLLLSSFAFDSSVAGIFWTLSCGGTLFIPEDDLYLDPAYLVNLIQGHQVSHLLCIPSFHQLLLSLESNPPTSLTTVILAGEPCPLDLVHQHFQILPQAALFNEYGPTEATVWSTVFDCRTEIRGETVPIGQSIPYTQAYVLGTDKQPVPAGIAGELYIGGKGIARGYLNDPELTQSRFYSNPFVEDSEELMYKTGDLVRCLPDGNLEFLGRSDRQTKIRGYRVDLGDIESHLRLYPGIQEAAVIVEDGLDVNKNSPRNVVSDTDSEVIIDQLSMLPLEKSDQLIAEIEMLSQEDAHQMIRKADEGHSNQKSELEKSRGNAFEEGKQDLPIQKRHSRFNITLELKDNDFIHPPRKSQKDWLINQSLNELAADLEHLHELAGNFVPGMENTISSFDATHPSLSANEIMEDWQIPIMESMAKHVTESHGDVLEIGFGRGISATYIQDLEVHSHTIIESDKDCIETYFKPWHQQYSDRNIRLIHGKWQDVLPQLDLYNGIFFHAYPTNEAEFITYILNSTTFAEHFFPSAARLLKAGGVFTYLTTEIDSLSRRHQRLLFTHFKSLTQSLQALQIPKYTKDAWWVNSMVIIKAIK